MDVFPTTLRRALIGESYGNSVRRSIDRGGGGGGSVWMTLEDRSFLLVVGKLV